LFIPLARLKYSRRNKTAELVKPQNQGNGGGKNLNGTPPRLEKERTTTPKIVEETKVYKQNLERMREGKSSE